MDVKEVTLSEVLKARDRRAATQKKLLDRYRAPLICFTMNIPGPVKWTPLISRGFAEGNRLLQASLARENIPVLYQKASEPATGCVAFLAADAAPETLKRITVSIENSSPVGRLFDMDVLNIDGLKLDRQTLGSGSRNCIVCGASGRGCASRRVHSVAQLQAAAAGLLRSHFALADARHIGELAVQSLLEEVRTTPKPGLVDLRNTGSHQDMDVNTFTASARALMPYFQQCIQIGQETARLSPCETFPRLREAGLMAETQMYQATSGINTHKGAIYTMGILCGALGRLWNPEKLHVSIPDLLTQCAQIVSDSAASDFAQKAADTAGLRLYREKGLTGIRGEMAAGLPSVANISLPAFRNALAHGCSRNDAGTIALLHLIAGVEDTNLYHRGGEAGAAFAKNCAAALFAENPLPTPDQITRLDDAFIVRNLSPGGCADLLAATYFLDSLVHSTPDTLQMKQR